jgi:hypothetical protein
LILTRKNNEIVGVFAVFVGVYEKNNKGITREISLVIGVFGVVMGCFENWGMGAACKAAHR